MMIHDVDPVSVGQRIGMTFDPDDIHIMRKSDFSPDRRQPDPSEEERIIVEDV